MSNQSALIGAVVFAWCPLDENPKEPGPKYRPVLIMHKDGDEVMIAYGTSQNLHLRYRGEVILTKDELPGLSKDTKFNLKKSFWVPLSKAFFARDPGNGISVIGRIPRQKYDHFARAIQEAFPDM